MAHQTKSKMRQIKDLIRSVLGILKQMIHALVGCLTLKFESENDTWKNWYVIANNYPNVEAFLFYIVSCPVSKVHLNAQ